MKYKSANYMIYLTIIILILLSMNSQGQYNQFHWLITLLVMANIYYFWESFNGLRNKAMIFLASFTLLAVQLTFHSNLVFHFSASNLLYNHKKPLIISSMFLLLLFFTFAYFYRIYSRYYETYKTPSAFTYETVKTLHNKGKGMLHTFEDTREKINGSSVKYVMSEIPRHGYVSYKSQNNLPVSFFENAKEAIATDKHLYLILSNTGSPASEIISVFTQRDYNHVSLSFDRDLKTIISYNGGDHLQQPGLNTESLQLFYQKPDSSIIVYRLEATKEQQEIILSKIKTINEEGSAYNLLGLMTGVSVKPNIMFCSQFVYSVLQEAGLSYFKASQSQVKPTDFVELDYFRKLQFEYELQLSEILSLKK